MMHKAWIGIQEVSYFFFSRSSVKLQVHMGRKVDDLAPILSVSWWQFQFEFTDGYEITHIASRGMEEVPCVFSRSSVKVIRDDKSMIRCDLSKITRLVAAIKSLRFALFLSTDMTILLIMILQFRTAVLRRRLSYLRKIGQPWALNFRHQDFSNNYNHYKKLITSYQVLIDIVLRLRKYLTVVEIIQQPSLKYLCSH